MEKRKDRKPIMAQCRNEGTYDQIIGSGMEGYECVVGGGAPDDYGADKTFSGDYGMDEAHNHDFFKTNGG